jgi:hypothetical protein
MWMLLSIGLAWRFGEFSDLSCLFFLINIISFRRLLGCNKYHHPCSRRCYEWCSLFDCVVKPENGTTTEERAFFLLIVYGIVLLLLQGVWLYTAIYAAVSAGTLLEDCSSDGCLGMEGKGWPVSRWVEVGCYLGFAAYFFGNSLFIQSLHLRTGIEEHRAHKLLLAYLTLLFQIGDDRVTGNGSARSSKAEAPRVLHKDGQTPVVHREQEEERKQVAPSQPSIGPDAIEVQHVAVAPMSLPVRDGSSVAPPGVRDGEILKCLDASQADLDEFLAPSPKNQESGLIGIELGGRGAAKIGLNKQENMKPRRFAGLLLTRPCAIPEVGAGSPPSREYDQVQNLLREFALGPKPPNNQSFYKTGPFRFLGDWIRDRVAVQQTGADMLAILQLKDVRERILQKLNRYESFIIEKRPAGSQRAKEQLREEWSGFCTFMRLLLDPTSSPSLLLLVCRVLYNRTCNEKLWKAFSATYQLTFQPAADNAKQITIVEEDTPEKEIQDAIEKLLEGPGPDGGPAEQAMPQLSQVSVPRSFLLPDIVAGNSREHRAFVNLFVAFRVYGRWRSLAREFEEAYHTDPKKVPNWLRRAAQSANSLLGKAQDYFQQRNQPNAEGVATGSESQQPAAGESENSAEQQLELRKKSAEADHCVEASSHDESQASELSKINCPDCSRDNPTAVQVCVHANCILAHYDVHRKVLLARFCSLPFSSKIQSVLNSINKNFSADGNFLPSKSQLKPVVQWLVGQHQAANEQQKAKIEEALKGVVNLKPDNAIDVLHSITALLEKKEMDNELRDAWTKLVTGYESLLEKGQALVQQTTSSSPGTATSPPLTSLQSEQDSHSEQLSVSRHFSALVKDRIVWHFQLLILTLGMLIAMILLYQEDANPEPNALNADDRHGILGMWALELLTLAFQTMTLRIWKDSTAMKLGVYIKHGLGSRMKFYTPAINSIFVVTAIHNALIAMQNAILIPFNPTHNGAVTSGALQALSLVGRLWYIRYYFAVWQELETPAIPDQIANIKEYGPQAAQALGAKVPGM